MDIEHIGPPAAAYPPAAGERTLSFRFASVLVRLRFGRLRARRAMSVRRAVAMARMRLNRIRVRRALVGAMRRPVTWSYVAFMLRGLFDRPFKKSLVPAPSENPSRPAGRDELAVLLQFADPAEYFAGRGRARPVHLRRDQQRRAA